MKKSNQKEQPKEPVVLTVHVVPRASRTEIVGEHNGALRVRIAAPPVDGLANEELIRFLAKTYDVAKRDVSVVSGQGSRIKRVRIEWRKD